MRARGFTLVELLIALALFLVLLGFAYQTTVRFFQIRSDQDAATSAQAKLRRVVEVLTQELRSSVLGAVVDEPYPSGADRISFATLRLPEEGSATSIGGHKVTRLYLEELTLLAGATPPVEEGGRLLVVNRDSGKAVVVDVSDTPTRVPAPSGSKYYQWRIPHAGCRNPLSYSSNTLAFPLRLLGLRYDAGTRRLFFYEDGEEAPMAYDIAGFQIAYVYLNTRTGAYTVNPPGFSPTKKAFGDYVLKRLRLSLAAEVPGRTRSFRRELVAPVELASLNATGSDELFYLREVVPCD